jgi:PTH1 family peptidyl-tRNA hydrolase
MNVFRWLFDIFPKSCSPGLAERMVFGIGNPGAQYAGTRHNAGFLLVDALAVRVSGARTQNVHQAQLITGQLLEGPRIALVKPLTFVNRSGHAFERVRTDLVVPLDRCLVVSDDLNLPLGAIRFRRGGSHGGHNGLRSIIDASGADFPRLRIGIGSPPKGGSVIDFVLGRFSAEEARVLDEALARAVQGVQLLCASGIEAAMNAYNAGDRRAGSTSPQSPSSSKESV